MPLGGSSAYAGMDGIWKPCLLNSATFSPFTEASWEDQILDRIHLMVGNHANWEFQEGAPY